MRIKPYVSLCDITTVCPFVSQLQPTHDEFLTQRINARVWLDNAIRTHNIDPTGDRCEVVVDHGVKQACAYKAASEILAQQITPNMDNAYSEMAARYQRIAESQISALHVTIYTTTTGTRYTVNLGITQRGRYV